MGISVGSKRLQEASDIRKVIKLMEKAKENVVELERGRLEKGRVKLEVFTDTFFGECGGREVTDWLHGRFCGQSRR